MRGDAIPDYGRAQARLDKAALDFPKKLTGMKERRYGASAKGVATFIPLEVSHGRICRESVRRSMILEIDQDVPIYITEEKYGRAIDKWIEDHIELIGDAAFL